MLQCKCFALLFWLTAPTLEPLRASADVPHILCLSLLSFLRRVCSMELFLCFISEFPSFYGSPVGLLDWVTVIFASGETCWGLWFLRSSFHRPRLSSATVLGCPTLLGGNHQWDMGYQRGTSQLCSYGLLVSCTDELVHMVGTFVPDRAKWRRWKSQPGETCWCASGGAAQASVRMAGELQQFVAPFPQEWKHRDGSHIWNTNDVKHTSQTLEIKV